MKTCRFHSSFKCLLITGCGLCPLFEPLITRAQGTIYEKNIFLGNQDLFEDSNSPGTIGSGGERESKLKVLPHRHLFFGVYAGWGGAGRTGNVAETSKLFFGLRIH